MRNSFCLTWPAKTLGKFAVCVCVYVVVCVCVLFWPVWGTSPCCFALPLHLTCVLLPLFHCPFALIKRGAQVCPFLLPTALPPFDFVCHCALCLMLCKLLPWLLFAIRFRQGMGCFVHFLALATLQLEFLSIQPFICHCFCRPSLCFAAVVVACAAAALKAA